MPETEGFNFQEETERFILHRPNQHQPGAPIQENTSATLSERPFGTGEDVFCYLHDM